MTLHTKLGLAGAFIFILAGILGFRSWLAEHDLRMKADANVEAQKELSDKADAAIKELQDAVRDRDAKAAEEVAKDKADAAKQVTAAQMAAWIPKQIPNAPQPITVNIPPATASNPTPNAIATIPQADLAPLRDYISKCQIETVQLAACNADVVSRDAQLKQAGDKLTAMTKERDDYKVALNGGTFWQRTKKAAKYLTVGGGIAIVAICGSGHCK